MKIAVPATDGNLDANVDLRFGRCPYYVIFEVEENKIKNHEILENKTGQEMRGVGITASQMIVNKEVEVVITGNIGPNAFNVLSGTGMKIITGVNGNVKEVVEKYLNGELKETNQPSPGFGKGRE